MRTPRTLSRPSSPLRAGDDAETVAQFHTGGANAVFVDGSVHFLPEGLNRAVFAALVTRAGGEMVDGAAF